MRVLGISLRRIAVCCLLAVMASAAFADQAKTDLESVIPPSRGRITQEAYDGLKAGKPQLTMISLHDGKVEAAAEADRQERHLTHDDAVIIATEVAAYKAMKAQLLADYPPGEIEVTDDEPRLPELMIRIHSLRTLQQLLADPRIRGIFVGPMRAYPAAVH